MITLINQERRMNPKVPHYEFFCSHLSLPPVRLMITTQTARLASPTPLICKVRDLEENMKINTVNRDEKFLLA
jgi:hypothetical protein